jgi:acyl dehydratase
MLIFNKDHPWELSYRRTSRLIGLMCIKQCRRLPTYTGKILLASSAASSSISAQHGLTTPRLNGDYNPLHATPEPGQELGYGGIIMHGLFSWNVAARCILSRYGGGKAEAFRDFEARFVAPVKPGDKLQISMWDLGELMAESKEALREVRFEVKVGERLVLTNGRALLVPGSGVGSKL